MSDDLTERAATFGLILDDVSLVRGWGVPEGGRQVELCRVHRHLSSFLGMHCLVLLPFLAETWKQGLGAVGLSAAEGMHICHTQ